MCFGLNSFKTISRVWACEFGSGLSEQKLAPNPGSLFAFSGRRVPLPSSPQVKEHLLSGLSASALNRDFRPNRRFLQFCPGTVLRALIFWEVLPYGTRYRAQLPDHNQKTIYGFRV